MSKEADVLPQYLNAQRRHVLGILDGLSDADLRRPLLPSGWSCLGMVNHLTITVERFWFRGVVAGNVWFTEQDPGPVWRVGPEVSAESVLDLYRREIELCNEVIATTDLDAPPAAWPDRIWPDWRLDDLREVMLHVITEVACHAGHLDAVRELIDGRTWMHT
jgi:hypothetical protein